MKKCKKIPLLNCNYIYFCHISIQNSMPLYLQYIKCCLYLCRFISFLLERSLTPVVSISIVLPRQEIVLPIFVSECRGCLYIHTYSPIRNIAVSSCWKYLSRSSEEHRLHDCMTVALQDRMTPCMTTLHGHMHDYVASVTAWLRDVLYKA